MASINLEKQLFMKNNTAYCGQLQLFTDSRRYDKEAGLAASRIFLVFFVSAVLALAAIYLYSRSFRNKVDKSVREPDPLVKANWITGFFSLRTAEAG